MNNIQQQLVNLCIAERARQDIKWGKQLHNNEHWMAILTEEVGESAEAVLQNGKNRNLEDELIQVMATAMAWLECIEEKRKEQNYL